MTRIRIGETQINGTKMLKSDGTTLTPVKYGYQGVRTRSELLDGGKKKKKSENFLQPWWMSNVRMCKKRRWTEISPRGNKKRYCQPTPNFFELLQSSTTTEINQISRHYIIYFLKLRICMRRGSFLKFSWEWEHCRMQKWQQKIKSLHTFFCFHNSRVH